MNQRTCKFCEADISDRHATARYCSGSCSRKYARQHNPDQFRRHQRKYRESAKGKRSRRQSEYRDRECVQCGITWSTPRPDAKLCSNTCRSDYYRSNGYGATRIHSNLPASHPVMVLRRQMDTPPRECPGCAAVFVPLHSTTRTTCSSRCMNRIKDRRRRAREAGAYGDWRWSEFMRMALRFGFRCAYCGTKPEGQLDPDHVIPLSKGGANTVANLLPACRACNCDKRDLLLHEWNADRARRGLEPRITAWASDDSRFTHLATTSLVA